MLVGIIFTLPFIYYFLFPQTLFHPKSEQSGHCPRDLVAQGYTLSPHFTKPNHSDCQALLDIFIALIYANKLEHFSTTLCGFIHITETN